MIQQNRSPENKRPPIITVACVFGLIDEAIKVTQLFSPLSPQARFIFGPLLPWSEALKAISAVSIVARLVSIIGIWKMKKLGIVVYTAFSTLSLILTKVVLARMEATGSVSSTNINWDQFLIPGFVIVVGFYHFSKME